MHYVVGLIRSCILYCAILSTINGEPLFNVLILYIAFLLIHSVILKLQGQADIGQNLIDIAIHDIIEPFLGIRAFLDLLLRKERFSGSPKFIMIDKFQVYSESAYGIIVVLLLVLSICSSL